MENPFLSYVMLELTVVDRKKYPEVDGMFEDGYVYLSLIDKRHHCILDYERRLLSSLPSRDHYDFIRAWAADFKRGLRKSGVY